MMETELRVLFPPSGSKKLLEPVLKAVCAILNSCRNGGRLIVYAHEKVEEEICYPYSQKDVDDITRKIEQKLQATFGVEPAREILTRIPTTTHEVLCEMCFEVKPTTLLPLYTINYNLYVTTDTQVHEVPASERLEHVVEIIKGDKKHERKRAREKKERSWSTP